MTIEPYTVDHFVAVTGQAPNGEACLSAIAGPAFTLMDGGKVYAMGGVRVQGIGQAWALLAPGAEKRLKTVLRAFREGIGHCIVSERLYRVYAEESAGKPAFLRHLGFIQSERLFVR